MQEDLDGRRGLGWGFSSSKGAFQGLSAQDKMPSINSVLA
jgi:hypothetical protein